MIEFLKWYFADDSIFVIVMLVILFWAGLFFTYNKLYKLALVFGLVFVIGLFYVANGSIGTHMQERISGKREPMFKVLTNEELKEAKERLKREREQ